MEKFVPCIKKLFALLKGIASIHHGDICCLSCLLSFRKKKIESHKVCENKDFCDVTVHSENTKELEFK